MSSIGYLGCRDGKQNGNWEVVAIRRVQAVLAACEQGMEE